MKRRRLPPLLLSAAVLTCLSRPADALTDVIWNGGAGNWGNAAMWSPATVPNGALYNVLLDNGNALNSVVDLDMWATIGGLTIDSGDMLRISNAQLLNLSNANVSNAGTILLNSAGSATYLWITGGVNLTGTGKITLGGSGNNYVTYSGSPGTDILTSSQTIEGRGELDVLLNNQATGIVDANASGGTLTLKRSVTNDGTLRASNGGTLSLNSIAVTNSGGVITSTSGGIVELNTSTINGGTLTNSGGTLNIGNSHLNGAVGGGVTLNGTMNIGNGNQPIVSGTLQNNGVINFAASGSTTYLLINGAVNLQGSGNITMGGTGPNQIRYNGSSSTDTLNSYQTIQGAGDIGVNLNNTTGQLVDANINSSTLGISAPTTNAGTLRASNGGTLSLNSVAVANTGGTIQALASSTVNFNSGTRIDGGTVKNTGGTMTFGNGGATFDGTDAAGITLQGTMSVPNGVTLTLLNTVHNQGTLAITPNGSTTYIRVGGDGTGTVTLDGGGTVSLTASTAVLDASNIGNRLVNVDNTISGVGNIGSANLKLDNGGLIHANVDGGTLTVMPQAVAGGGINTGTMRASGGGLLTIQNTIQNVAGTIEALADSRVNVTSGTIQQSFGGVTQAIGAGEIRLSSGQILDGSLLNSSTGIIRSASGTSRINTLNNPVGGQVIVDSGTTLALQGALTNHGTIAVNAAGSTTSLNIEGTVTLLGTGSVTLGSSSGGTIASGSNVITDALVNPSQTIQGYGSINVFVNNQSGGTVRANVPGQTLTMYQNVTNAGLLQGTNSGTLSLNSIAVANSGGVITSTSGGIVELNTSTINGGTLTNSGGTLNIGNSHLNGAVGGGVTINGTVSIGNGNQPVVSGTIQNNGVINFAASGSTSYLLINGAVNLQGSGNITMGGAGPNQIRYNGSGATDTLNSYQTIQGAGAIAVNLNNTTGQLVDANINGSTLGLYFPTTNDGTLRASNGGTLSLNDIAVANTSGVITSTSGSTVNLNSSTINGGTLTNSAGTINSGNAHLNGAVGGGITLNGTMNIGNGNQPIVSGTLQNNGVINFAAQGSTTYLLINGTVNLQGSGNITMGGTGPNQIRYNGSGATDTLNSYQTIQGAGAIGVNLNNTTGQLVDANIPGQTLGISAPTTNAGTLRASNGGTLSLNSVAVENTGGTILAQTGSTVNLNSSTINGGTVTNSGGTLNAGFATVLNGTVGGGVTLNGTMNIGNGSQPRLSGTIQNNGVINFAAQGSTTYLLINGAVNLQGSGSITMGGDGPNQIQYQGDPINDVLNNAQTIQGKGTVAVKLNNQSGGLVDGNISGQTLTIGANLTNVGTLRASGGGALTITTTTITNVGGLIQAQTGSTVNFANGAVVNGGTVQNSGGTFSFGSVTLDGTDSAGITLQGTFGVPIGSTVTLVNTIHNQGSVSLNSSGSTTVLNVGGDGTGVATLLNGGTITLGANGGGSVLSASSTGNRLINENNTLQGQGTLGNTQAKLTNRGVIDANVSGGTLVFNPNTTGGATINSGTIRASGGGTLTVQSSIANSEGATNGTIEATAGAIVRVEGTSVTSGTVRTVGTGQIKLASGTVTGGSLLNSSTGIIRAESGTSLVNGLNNSGGGQVFIDNGAVLVLQNTVQNDGTILVNPNGSASYAFIDGAVTLQGSGKITLGSNGPSQLRYNNSAATDTLISSQTIDGAGTIAVRLTNQIGGMVDSNLTGGTIGLSAATTNAGTLGASNGGTLSLNDIAVANTGGLITATTGGTVNLNSSTINGGTLTNSGGTLNTGFSTHLNGAVGGGIALNGTMSIGNGNQPIVSGTVQNNGVINFAAQGSTTYLLMNGAVNLQGTGNITMAGQGPNQIRYNGDPVNDSLTSAQTIQGAGSIGVNLTNQSTGLVNANISGQTLSLLNNITNTGILQASGGGTLSTSPAVVSNVGGTIQALASSTVNFNSGTRIDGGIVRNTSGTMTFGSGATFDGTDAAGITLQGAMSVPNGVTLTLLNTVHNQGTLSITPSGSSTYIRVGGDGTGTVTLDGGGTVSLTASTAVLDASNIGNRLVNVDNTISGVGSIGSANLKLDNGGLIHANVDGGTLTVMPQAVAGGGVNTGTMRASGGGLLTIQNTIEK